MPGVGRSGAARLARELLLEREGRPCEDVVEAAHVGVALRVVEGARHAHLQMEVATVATVAVKLVKLVKLVEGE